MPPAFSIRACLAVLWLLLQLLAAGPALAAGDLIISRAWLVDEQARLSIEEVVDCPFTAYEGSLSRGYTDAAHWVRLVLRRPEQGERVVLRISPSQLDEVRLYEPDGAGGWRTRVTGDRHPRAQREVASLVLGFVVHVSGEETTVYLRTKTSSLSGLMVEALEPLQAQAQERGVDQLQLLALFLVVWLLVWTLVRAVAERDGLLALLALNLSGFVLHSLALMGYLGQWWPGPTPEWDDGFTSVIVCTWPALTVLFDSALLRRYRLPRGWQLGSAALLLACPVELALLAKGHALLALEMNYFLHLVGRWYLLAVSLVARPGSGPSLGYVRFMLAVFAIMMSIIMVTELGWMSLPQSGLRRVYYLFVFSAVCSGLLFVLVRSRTLERRRAAGQAALQVALQVALSEQALALERSHREAAQQLANTDALTGLPNRRHFLELGAQRVAAAAAAGRPLAVLMVDVDHFKALNDNEGHLGGDRALRCVAERLRDALRPQDLIGRFGGEEFAALLDGSDAVQALHVARRLRAAVAGEVVELADGRCVGVTVSIGFTELSGRRIGLGELLHEADLALYAAKARGRDTECGHGETIAAAAGQRARLTQALAGALDAGQLSLAYQPVLCARSGAALGAEALLRWSHPQLGEVPPGRFIEIAEDTGLILPIGAWVLRQACTEAAHWPLPLKLSVNLSARQLHSAGLVDEVREALRLSGLAPQRLELEITESALAEPGPAAAALAALRALGVRLALDDFGTGYSSLAYLRQFPFDRLKIDRSFVQPLRSAGQRTAKGLVRAIVDLARALDLNCTAEGIETAEQQGLLRELGCDVLQGFHLARPMAAERLRDFFVAPGNAALAAPA